MNLPKVYEPSEYENDIYALWEQSGVFKADPDCKAERFTIAMPPPNATGQLHLGHTLGVAVQDIMIRYARMQGKDALWLPGTDHAAMATNAIIEKRLTDQGTNKHQVGREEFLRLLREFIEESRTGIQSQFRAVGASADWSRERYTMDNTLNRCVNETFTKMYNDGLIYRGHRIVNWDPNLETNVSDDELVRIEQKAHFYTFKYGPFNISTARPETKFGDKYVVMHPDDKRYAKYQHGDTFETEWLNGKVMATVIKDSAVDPAFGTGVMTITPWHDHTDFEIAERHGLDKEQVIDFHGKLLPIAGEFAGMHISEARPKIVEKLQSKGLLVGIDENYVHAVAVNERGKGIIEPQIRLQWFVDVNKPVVAWKGKKLSLKQVMRAVIDDQDITIVPARFNKIYFHWIDNLRDWCISRQIWWGHRIPVWYRQTTDGEQTFVGVQPPVDDGHEGWSAWEQDPDTLDTWFSSALWSWSTLVDPKLAANFDLSLDEILAKSQDYQTYHPTDVLETGWDIIFFWVARMILATTYMTGQVPFKTVYLHGLVRNEAGQKMSKSKPETAINPLEVIPEFGTDALRLALINGLAPGNDQRLGKSKIAAQRNFCNKLWNVARFIEAKVGDDSQQGSPKAETVADAWMLSKLQQTIKKMTADLDAYRFSEAYATLYHFVWDDFADWYIEASKVHQNNAVLVYGLETILKLAHPFAPFVTETIWQTLKWEEDSLLIVSKWPDAPRADKKAAQAFEAIIALVGEIRFIRAATGATQPHLYHTSSAFIAEHADVIKKLAGVSQISDVKDGSGLHLTQTTETCWLDLDHTTITAFVEQLDQAQAATGQSVARLESRLANQAYLHKAPKALIAETKQQLADAQQLLAKQLAEYDRFRTGA